jgi:hypothetical protein
MQERVLMADVMARAEIQAVCKEFNLPNKLIRMIFVHADTNLDKRWNSDECIPAMYASDN